MIGVGELLSVNLSTVPNKIELGILDFSNSAAGFRPPKGIEASRILMLSNNLSCSC